MTVLSNRTGYYYCNTTLESYVYNLTSSYTDQKNEATMAATSMVLLFLAALFFILNLFSSFSDVSAILNPSIRLFLSVTLSLFLPVMSYLFSEAKNQGVPAATDDMAGDDELSLQARTILMWMLLVELLYKNVQAIFRATADEHGYSGTIERATRIVWLGYLVFYNLRNAGKKAFYGVLWLLAAAKLVQRFVTSELGKRSFAYGKNPQLLASYMAQITTQQEVMPPQELDPADATISASGSELLKQCKYAVMGEEDLEKKAVSKGYRLELKEVMAAEADDEAEPAVVVTVGMIWKLSESESDRLLHRDPTLKRLCLSFALYKLLRRNLEGFPITPGEARNCHSLIFNGLCREQDTSGDDKESSAAAVLFQVLNDEGQFLCDYYHSVHPVIAVHTFRADNFPVSVGILRITVCLLSKVNSSPPVLFSTVDLSITVLLFLAFAYEQVWEFIVFLLSNWFMVSLLCTYASKKHCRDSPLLTGVIRRILWVRNKLSRPNVCFKQFSVLGCCFCRLSSSFLLTKAVPMEAKKAILERLDSARDFALPRLSSTLHVDDIDDADVILTLHIATALLDANTKTPLGHNRKVAVALSRYCAYLVAFRPELLPDEKDATARVWKETQEDLKKAMGGWRYYYFSRQATRCDKLVEIAAGRQPTTETTALCKGARLGNVLIERYKAAATATTTDTATRELEWQQLADLWTEVVVYAAPTASERHLMAHKEALAQGGEFITLLWAVATHTGISRETLESSSV
ncbi:hypothetical protein BS78_10G013400 [Paspalum vaginatum]|nr:hypothetical protein BS78_10G013400 [Paspalum vaginatum]